jgi:tetratricopeptide (TPR) repeat protein
MEHQQWQRAEQLLQQAVRTCSTDPDARRNYAEVLWHRGARQEAVAQLEEAARLAPGDPALEVRLAEMRLAMNQPDRAMRHAERALELAPRLPAAWTMRGRVLQANGQAREALAAYHRALGYGPADRSIPLEIAELYGQIGEPQRALVTLQTLAEAYSPGEEPQRVLFLEGLAHQALERYEEAIESFSAANARIPPSPEALYHLAECQLALGRPRGAAAAAREALALAPHDQASRELLSRIELAQQPYPPAKR